MASSPKIDVWALGVILYSMLFGVFPFDGNSDEEILRKIDVGDYSCPKNIDISKTCKSILTKFLDKKPSNRIDLYDDLFDVWYEENSPDTVIIKTVEEEQHKINSNVVKKYTSTNTNLKEKPNKYLPNLKELQKKNLDFHINSTSPKGVSVVKLETKHDTPKTKEYTNNTPPLKKIELRKVEKKK